MTDKEIQERILQVMEMAQEREEVHVLHAKVMHARMHSLEQCLTLLGDLVGLDPGYERTTALERLERLIQDSAVPRQLKDLLARVESHHEKSGFLLQEMRARIEKME